MFIYSFSRGIIFALQSFWRNIWLSLATVFIVFLALVSVNFLIMLNVVTDSAVKAVKDRIDVSVYFKPEVTDSKIAEVKAQLESLAQVRQVDFKSAEDNLSSFSERHKNDVKIQETLKELNGNPMGATLVIRAKDIKDYPEILKTLDNPSYDSLIEEKNYDDNQQVIDRIGLISANVKKIMLAVSLIFIIIALLIVFNAVRVAIFTHQNEISIMKLVGAGNWFIRFPFVFETVLAGLLAVVVTILFLYPILSFAQGYLTSFFAGADFSLIAYFNQNFLLVFGGEALAIVILTGFSAIIAVSKYLNV